MKKWTFLRADKPHFFFARKLRAALRERKWSCGDLARHLSVSTPAVSRWICGERLPSAIMVEKIKAALGIEGNMVWEE